MAQHKERIIAWFFAIIFIVSTLAISVGVVFQMIQDSKKKDTNTASQDIQQQLNKEKNVNQLAGNPLAGFTPVPSITELQKIDSTPGTGKEVKAGEEVTVDYTGAVASTGIVFQSSKDSGQPVSFSLDGVIKGWTEGVPGMKEGGTRRLLIPAALAYGASPPPGSNIPANADLVFDITLIKVGK